jgi:hypothetical protein
MISVPVKPQTKEISIDGEQFDGLLNWSVEKKFNSSALFGNEKVTRSLYDVELLLIKSFELSQWLRSVKSNTRHQLIFGGFIIQATLRYAKAEGDYNGMMKLVLDNGILLDREQSIRNISPSNTPPPKKNKAEVNKAEWSAAKKDRDALIDRVAKALKIKPASRARVSNKKRVAATAEALQGKRSKEKTRKRPERVLVPEKTSERAIDI